MVPPTHLSHVKVLTWCCLRFSTLSRSSVIQTSISVCSPQPMDNTGRHIEPFCYCPYGFTILQHLDGPSYFRFIQMSLRTPKTAKLAIQKWSNKIRVHSDWISLCTRQVSYLNLTLVLEIMQHKAQLRTQLLTKQVSFAGATTQDTPLKNRIFTIAVQLPTFAKYAWKSCSFNFF